VSDGKNRSDLIRQELKRRSDGEKIVDVEEQRTKIIIVTLDGHSYAFYGNDIKEILPMTPIYYVPGAPDFILGVINNRGDIESVIAVEKFLGLPGTPGAKRSRIAIAEKEGVRSGIRVDSIEDVVDVPTSSIKPPLSTLDGAGRDLVAGEVQYSGKIIVLLDVGRMLGRIAP
jgi:purine-binding chemotaxis protein CheW